MRQLASSLLLSLGVAACGSSAEDLKMQAARKRNAETRVMAAKTREVAIDVKNKKAHEAASVAREAYIDFLNQHCAAEINKVCSENKKECRSDFDQDGLPDWFEGEIDADASKSDTDGDLVSDYEEYCWLGTSVLEGEEIDGGLIGMKVRTRDRLRLHMHPTQYNRTSDFQLDERHTFFDAKVLLRQDTLSGYGEKEDVQNYIRGGLIWRGINNPMVSTMLLTQADMCVYRDDFTLLKYDGKVKARLIPYPLPNGFVDRNNNQVADLVELVCSASYISEDDVRNHRPVAESFKVNH